MSPEPLLILFNNALLRSSSLGPDAAAALGFAVAAAGASFARELFTIMQDSATASKERGNWICVFMGLVTAILEMLFILLYKSWRYRALVGAWVGV
jgi:hypothetical protein